MKVMTIVGTRPEIIKLSRVISRLDECVSHVLVHTGQNYDYELSEIFFQQLDIRSPDHFLNTAGETLASTIGNVITRADQVLAQEQPDALLLLGDTNSCLSAIPAKRRKVPIFHMEAGNRCFDMRVPEEMNRRIVDHISDLNMPYSEQARLNLLAEGFSSDRVIKTGSPMKEVLEYHRAGIESSDVLARLGLEQGKYFVASLHREENVDVDKTLAAGISALNTLTETYNHPIIFSTHPRTRKRLTELSLRLDERIRIMKPLGFLDYVQLQKHALCTISDSGTVTEESSILGFPAITAREQHERPEGMDEGTLIMAGLHEERLLESLDVVLRQFREYGPTRLVADYDVDNVSWKVVKIILSYVDYVNRKVWHKY